MKERIFLLHPGLKDRIARYWELVEGFSPDDPLGKRIARGEIHKCGPYLAYPPLPPGWAPGRYFALFPADDPSRESDWKEVTGSVEVDPARGLPLVPARLRERYREKAGLAATKELGGVGLHDRHCPDVGLGCNMNDPDQVGRCPFFAVVREAVEHCAGMAEDGGLSVVLRLRLLRRLRVADRRPEDPRIMSVEGAAMTDRELDALVAEKVMGFEWCTFCGRTAVLMRPHEAQVVCWPGSSWERGVRAPGAKVDLDGATFSEGVPPRPRFVVPRYATDIRAAWEIVDLMGDPDHTDGPTFTAFSRALHGGASLLDASRRVCRKLCVAALSARDVKLPGTA